MKTILVADEDPMQRQLVDLLLAADQYSIQNFEGGRAVLEHLRDNTPDLAILDIDLPEIGGADICGKMRKVSRLTNVPVVLTAPQQADNRLDAETRQLGRLVRANLVVQKPLGDKNLRARIKQLIETTDKHSLITDRAVRNTLVLEETLNELDPRESASPAPTSGEILRLREQIKLLQSEKGQLQDQLRTLKAARNPTPATTNDEVEQLREEVAKQKKKIDKLQRRNHLLRDALEQEKSKPRRPFFGRRRD